MRTSVAEAQIKAIEEILIQDLSIPDGPTMSVDLTPLINAPLESAHRTFMVSLRYEPSAPTTVSVKVVPIAAVHAKPKPPTVDAGGVPMGVEMATCWGVATETTSVDAALWLADNAEEFKKAMEAANRRFSTHIVAEALKAKIAGVSSPPAAGITQDNFDKAVEKAINAALHEKLGEMRGMMADAIAALNAIQEKIKSLSPPPNNKAEPTGGKQTAAPLLQSDSAADWQGAPEAFSPLVGRLETTIKLADNITPTFVFVGKNKMIHSQSGHTDVRLFWEMIQTLAGKRGQLCLAMRAHETRRSRGSNKIYVYHSDNNVQDIAIRYALRFGVTVDPAKPDQALFELDAAVRDSINRSYKERNKQDG